MLPNPLDQYTEDQSQDDRPLSQRLYVTRGRMPDDGVPIVPSPSNPLTQAVAPEASSELMQGLAALKEYLLNGKFSLGTKVGNRLLGTGGEERYQTWPERMIRSGATAPGEALASTEPITSEQMIAPAQDIAGLASGSTLFARPGVGTLGSGALRPGASAVETVKPVEPAPVFYSALEHATTNAAQDVMSPQQWLGYLKNQPGVKQEELAWTGLSDWLAGQKGKVKKEDVQAYLDEHKVEIKDVTKHGEDASLTPDVIEDAVQESLDSWKNEFKDEHGRNPNAEEIEAARTDFHQDILNNPEQYEHLHEGDPSATKYSSYQLPGGDNYREHLLTMPYKPKTQLPEGWSVGPSQHVPEQFSVKNEKGEQVGPNYDTPERAMEKHNLYKGDQDYKSSHWDEPNVLAHVRTNDRIMAGEAPKLVVARRMPDDTVQYGKAGQVHSDLLSDKELLTGLDKTTGEMGFAHPGGKFVSRSDAIDFANKNEPSRAENANNKGRGLEAVEYNNGDAKPIKSLHIEEIQSDWHQQGRKQGYKDDAAGKAYDEYMSDLRDRIKNDTLTIAKQHGISDERAQVLAAESLRKMQPHEMARFFGEEPQMKALWDAKVVGDKGVPDAPFKTTWPELALKRMIRHAAEEGYDRISWTSGEAQAARYDLSKHYKELRLTHNREGVGELQMQPASGTSASIPIKSKDDLVNAVGKDLADKLYEQGYKNNGKAKLEGLDLKIGGEGMREFYDKMLPKMAEKIGKAHGVKVKTTNIETGGPESILLYRRNGDLEGKFASEAEAKAYAEKYDIENYNIKGADSHPIHYFDLPPSLRDHAIGKGFPLYMSGIPFPLTPVDHDPFKKDD